MEPKIVYREILGGGNDQENQYANGLVVTLSYWNSDNFRVQSHYLMQAEVMINREIIVDETRLIAGYTWQCDAKHIRQAIAWFDQLRELNPETDPEYQAKVNDDFVAEQHGGEL